MASRASTPAAASASASASTSAPPPPPPSTAATAAATDEYLTPGVIGACLTIVPNATLWYGLSRGRNTLESFVRGVVRVAGVPGLLCVPFVGLSLEKTFYDTLVSLQGVNPNAQPPSRADDVSFPAGGHALPSFSLVPVKHFREYFR